MTSSHARRAQRPAGSRIPSLVLMFAIALGGCGGDDTERSAGRGSNAAGRGSAGTATTTTATTTTAVAVGSDTGTSSVAGDGAVAGGDVATSGESGTQGQLDTGAATAAENQPDGGDAASTGGLPGDVDTDDTVSQSGDSDGDGDVDGDRDGDGDGNGNGGGNGDAGDGSGNEADSSPLFIAVDDVIRARCLGCHGGSRAPNLSGYDAVAANASAIFSQIDAGRMPPGSPLPSSDATKIEAWIEAGKPR